MLSFRISSRTIAQFHAHACRDAAERGFYPLVIDPDRHIAINWVFSPFAEDPRPSRLARNYLSRRMNRALARWKA